VAEEVYPLATEEHALLIGSTQYVETIKRRHLFDRYSIVFHSFSVSERENDGKHIEKRYDKERRNTGG
jgi:hypothetical protein